MKISSRFATVLAFLLLTSLVARADTNLDIYCQVRPLNLSLTAWTNSPLHTNGILASTRSGDVRISHQDLIEALNGKSVYTLTKAITNWFTVKTNRNPNPIPDVYVTNYFQRAYLVNGPAVTASFSSGARLLLLESLGVNSPGPIPVIRDGSSPVDYSPSAYFTVRPASFEHNAQSAVIRSAKYDLLHSLVDSTEASIKSFVFDDQSTGQAGHISFDVQGLASEHVSSVTRTNVVLAERAARGMSASVSGLGLLGLTNNFAIIRGNVTAGEGKLELK